jgi:hypothetical protein
VQELDNNMGRKLIQHKFNMKRQRWLKKCQKNGWAVPETEYPNSLAATSGYSTDLIQLSYSAEDSLFSLAKKRLDVFHGIGNITRNSIDDLVKTERCIEVTPSEEHSVLERLTDLNEDKSATECVNDKSRWLEKLEMTISHVKNIRTLKGKENVNVTPFKKRRSSCLNNTDKHVSLLHEIESFNISKTQNEIDIINDEIGPVMKDFVQTYCN